MIWELVDANNLLNWKSCYIHISVLTSAHFLSSGFGRCKSNLAALQLMTVWYFAKASVCYCVQKIKNLHCEKDECRIRSCSLMVLKEKDSAAVQKHTLVLWISIDMFFNWHPNACLWFSERSCIWAPVSPAALTNMVPSVTALWAADPPLLNRSVWRTLVWKNFSTVMWKSTKPK